MAELNYQASPEEETTRSSNNTNEVAVASQPDVTSPTDATMVTGVQIITPNISRSVPTDYEIEIKPFVISPEWLVKSITNLAITAKAAPVLLCIAGLPRSMKTTATKQLLHQLSKKQLPDLEQGDHSKQSIHFYDLAAVRMPAETSLDFSKIDPHNRFEFVMESAIKHFLYLKGQFIKSIQCPTTTTIIFNDPELDQHLVNIMGNFNEQKKSRGPDLYWEQSLPSGISMINIWDIKVTKAVLYVLPLLAGHLYNSHVWSFFDLFRDVSSLHEPPYMPDNDCIMKWQARLYYLLRITQIASSNCSDIDRNNVCKFFAYHDGTNSNEVEGHKEKFKKEATFAATQMNVHSLIDLSNVSLFNPHEETCLKQLKKMFETIIHTGLNNTISIPLSYIFLRSLFYDTDTLFIKKKDLLFKANKLRMTPNSFEHFCQLFMSFGSIFDISLINKESEIVVLQPVLYLHKVDKLFYQSDDIDSLVTKYGLVTESTAIAIFGSEIANDMMASLVDFGIAAKIPSSKISGQCIVNDKEYVYYIPNACTTSPIAEHQPNTLCLLRDINRPMLHSKVAFTNKFLELFPNSLLYVSDKPHPVNVTYIKINTDTAVADSVNTLEIVYFGDAIEFRFPLKEKQHVNEHVLTQIITACHKTMLPTNIKYNFAVMCSIKSDPTALYKLQQHYHLLPYTHTEQPCQACKEDGNLNSTFLAACDTVLSKNGNKVEIGHILNGDPLSAEDAIWIAKKAGKELSPKRLTLLCEHLGIPRELPLLADLEKTHDWRVYMFLLLQWENYHDVNHDASKKVLAETFMKMVNSIYKEEGETEDVIVLKDMARFLNYRVAHRM